MPPFAGALHARATAQLSFNRLAAPSPQIRLAFLPHVLAAIGLESPDQQQGSSTCNLM